MLDSIDSKDRWLLLAMQLPHDGRCVHGGGKRSGCREYIEVCGED